MNIPLANRLKKRSQRDIALFQDILIRIIYEVDPNAEIHGGTAIWRCYNGRRFSKDIDVYAATHERWKEAKKKVEALASRYNAKIAKFRETENVIFMALLLGDTYSEIEVNFKKYYREPVVRQYENLDGTFSDVLTPPPEALISEKIAAYNDRKFITDLYDIRILIDYADVGKVKNELKEFISSLKEPSNLKEEEARLADLIFEGPIPTFSSLVEYIKGKIL